MHVRPAHKHTLKKSKLKLKIKSQTFSAFNSTSWLTLSQPKPGHNTFIQSEACESHIPPTSNPPQIIIQRSRHSQLLNTPPEICPRETVSLPGPGGETANEGSARARTTPAGGCRAQPSPTGSQILLSGCFVPAEKGHGSKDASPGRGKVSCSPSTVPRRRKLTVTVPHLSVGEISPSFLPLHPTLGNLTERVHVGTMCK